MHFETARLRLRARTPADLDAITAPDADPAVRACTGGPPDPEAHRARHIWIHLFPLFPRAGARH